MTNRKEEIREENKKSIRFFLILIVIGGIVGGIIGIFGSIYEESLNNVVSVINVHFPNSVFCVMVIIALLTHLIGWPTYTQCKKQLQSWDGEDDEVPTQINLRVGYLMWAITVNIIIAFLSFSVTIVMVNGISKAVIFLINIFLTIFLQQKLVDLLKEMNPEKKGSIYDIRFQKKWLESCDEAEKMKICQSGWASYRVMNYVYVFAWLLTCLANMFFEIGIFSTMLVSILWLIQSCVYSYKSIQLDR